VKVRCDARIFFPPFTPDGISLFEKADVFFVRHDDLQPDAGIILIAWVVRSIYITAV
jgi:hypothetical protein